MVGSAPQPDRWTTREASEVAADSPAGRPPHGASFLERVVQETLRFEGADDLEESAELQALHRIAVEHRQRASTLEAVLSDLVQTLLRFQFRGAAAHDRWRDSTSHQIVQTLLADTASRDRLEEFWQRFVGGAL